MLISSECVSTLLYLFFFSSFLFFLFVFFVDFSFGLFDFT